MTEFLIFLAFIVVIAVGAWLYDGHQSRRSILRALDSVKSKSWENNHD